MRVVLAVIEVCVGLLTIVFLALGIVRFLDERRKNRNNRPE